MNGNSSPLTGRDIEESSRVLRTLTERLNAQIVGKEKLIEAFIVGVLARGHILLEGLPGLGKTTLVRAFSEAIEIVCRRIQFTPDLLPGDITGTPMVKHSDHGPSFVFEKGPIFGNLILADEINRASPKTQSALLEAMQEQQVTVVGETYVLPDPFFVLATQNPIELEGTFPLPEAQLDRFLFKLDVGPSDVASLVRIVQLHAREDSTPQPPILNRERFLEIMALVGRVHLPDLVVDYIARLVHATHSGNSKSAEGVRFGASPRAVLALAKACRARALLRGRTHAGFEDVRELAVPVFGHRIVLDYGARISGKSSHDVVTALLAEIPTESTKAPKNLQEYVEQRDV